MMTSIGYRCACLHRLSLLPSATAATITDYGFCFLLGFCCCCNVLFAVAIEAGAAAAC